MLPSNSIDSESDIKNMGTVTSLKKNVYFLTGVTGELGEEILRVLLKSDSTIFCLVRDSKRQTYCKRLEEVLNRIGQSNNSDVKAIKGDISHKDLSMSNELYHQISKSITHIVHCAADVRFIYKIEELSQTNIEGTRNMLELATACYKNNPNFKVFGHVSTTFVAGQKEGYIKEIEPCNSGGFNNNYEKTKFEAEKLVCAYMKQGIPCIVFRPSIIFGSSESGFVSKRNIFYPYMLLFSKMKMPLIMPGSGKKLDVVPVDYVAKGLCHILQNKTNINRFYHLAAGPKKSIRKDLLFSIMIMKISSRKSFYIPYYCWNLVNRIFPRLVNDRKRMSLLGADLGYNTYSKFNKTTFLVEETERALRGSGIQFPERFDSVIGKCIDFAMNAYLSKK